MFRVEVLSTTRHLSTVCLMFGRGSGMASKGLSLEALHKDYTDVLALTPCLKALMEGWERSVTVGDSITLPSKSADNAYFETNVYLHVSICMISASGCFQPNRLGLASVRFFVGCAFSRQHL